MSRTTWGTGPLERTFRRSLAALAVAALAVGVATIGPAAGASTAGTDSTRSAAGTARTVSADGPPSGLGAPWRREVIRLGDRDDGPDHIEHVRELQYRLKWVGLYRWTPTGVFGGGTEQGVEAFQARKHLPVSGIMTWITWERLLQATLRDIGATPAVCKTAGWHACYDRAFHVVYLWHDGAVYNTWLVRGGASDLQTRLGTHRVYYRDIDHVSGEFGTAMPYSQFFDGGEALHGSPLMTNPFVGHSHGCINMYIEDARQLWNLTHAVPLWVTVYGNWA